LEKTDGDRPQEILSDEVRGCASVPEFVGPMVRQNGKRGNGAVTIRSSTMSSKSDIILYGHDGHQRTLDLRPGGVNVITGASRPGKSALSSIA